MGGSQTEGRGLWLSGGFMVRADRHPSRIEAEHAPEQQLQQLSGLLLGPKDHCTPVLESDGEHTEGSVSML